MDNCENKAVTTKVLPIKKADPMTYVLLLLDGGPNLYIVQ